MGQTARLRLIWDRFIAGHGNCDLRRHLDSVSPETPIREVVDRCRVWESHTDPAVRRIGKPNPDPTYPTYAVGNADSDNEVTRAAAVTGQRSGQNQLEDLLRWVISIAERPALKPEVSDIENCYSSWRESKIILVLHQTGIGRWTYMSYLTALHILLWKAALLAHNLENHLRCWFLIMLTPLASMLLSRTLQGRRCIHLHSRKCP